MMGILLTTDQMMQQYDQCLVMCQHSSDSFDEPTIPQEMTGAEHQEYQSLLTSHVTVCGTAYSGTLGAGGDCGVTYTGPLYNGQQQLIQNNPVAYSGTFNGVTSYCGTITISAGNMAACFPNVQPQVVCGNFNYAPINVVPANTIQLAGGFAGYMTFGTAYGQIPAKLRSFQGRVHGKIEVKE